MCIEPENDNLLDVLLEKRKELGWIVELPSYGPGFRQKMLQILEKDKQTSSEFEVLVQHSFLLKHLISPSISSFNLKFSSVLNLISQIWQILSNQISCDLY